jgi:hypothetical protein
MLKVKKKLYIFEKKKLYILTLLYCSALIDYEAAIKLDPNNAKLQEDADKLRQIIQGSQ